MSLDGLLTNGSTLSGVTAGQSTIVFPSTETAISIGGDFGDPGQVIAKDTDGTLHWDTVADITLPDQVIIARMINNNLGNPSLDPSGQGVFNITTTGDIICDEIVARKLDLTEDFTTRNINCEDILCENIALNNGASNHSITGLLNITGSGAIVMTGNITGNDFSGVDCSLSGTLGVSGTTTTAGITNTGAITTGTLTATGDLVGQDLTIRNITASGTAGITGATTTAGITNTGGIGTTTLTATGNIGGQDLTIRNITASGTTGITGATTTTSLTNSGLLTTNTFTCNSTSIFSGALTSTANISTSTDIGARNIQATGTFTGAILSISGDATISGNLEVVGDITYDGDFLTEDLTIFQSLTFKNGIAGAQTGDINATTGDATLNNIVGVNLTGSGTLTMTGLSTLPTLTSTTGTITTFTSTSATIGTITNTTINSGGAITGNSLISTTTISAGSTITAVGDITTPANMSCEDMTIGQDIAISRNATIGGTLEVTGNTTLNGDLTVQGTIIHSGADTDLTLRDLIVSRNLSVLGHTSLNTLSVSGLSALQVLTATTATITTANTTNIINSANISTATLTTTGDATIGGNLRIDGNLSYDGDLEFNDLQVDTFEVVDRTDSDALKVRFNPQGATDTNYYFADGLQVGENGGVVDTSRFRVSNNGVITQQANTGTPASLDQNILRGYLEIRDNTSTSGGNYGITLGGALGRCVIPSLTTGGLLSGTRQYTNELYNHITFIGSTDDYVSGNYRLTPGPGAGSASRSSQGAYLNNNLFFNTDDGVLEGFSASVRTDCKNLDLTDTSNLFTSSSIYSGNITDDYKERTFNTTSTQFDIINNQLATTFTTPSDVDSVRVEFSYYADVSSGMTYFLAPIISVGGQPQWCIDSMIRPTFSSETTGQHNEQFLLRGLVASTTYTFNIGIFCDPSVGHSITFKMGGGVNQGGLQPSSATEVYPGMFLKLYVENGSNTNTIPSGFS